MTLYDLYEVNKEKNPDYVILIKAGAFYETFGEDCYILKALFNYKIKCFNYGNRVGFPVVAYNKVLDTLSSFKINYLVLEKFEMVTRERFNKNKYKTYLSDDISIENRIQNIYENLNAIKTNPKIYKVLEQMEEVL